MCLYDRYPKSDSGRQPECRPLYRPDDLHTERSGCVPAYLLPDRAMSAAFTARYSGKCRSCRRRINVGDTVCYDSDDRVVHARCAGVEIPEDDPTVLRPREIVCPDCWTVKPCRCDE